VKEHEDAFGRALLDYAEGVVGKEIVERPRCRVLSIADVDDSLGTFAGGRIVAESLDPYGTDIPHHVAYQRRNGSRGRMPGQLRIRVRYRRRGTPWFDYLIVLRDELEELVGGTGLARPTLSAP
jgi:hypothetical protein